MKLVCFEAPGAEPGPGLLTDRGVVAIGEAIGRVASPQAALQRVIDQFEALRPRLEGLASQGAAVPLERVRLLAPVPRPGKILCSTARYDPTPGQEAAPLLMTLKSPESVIGPGDVIQLPAVGEAWQFVPETELGLVIRGPAKDVRAAEWQRAVFGYTCVVDVMARGDSQFGRDFWLAKSDTLGPLGPCIVTADEVPDPMRLRVRSWQNDNPRQDYSMADAEYGVPHQIEFATTVMTLQSGDVLACGTSPAGLHPLADGDRLEVEIDTIGRMPLRVASLAGSVA